MKKKSTLKLVNANTGHAGYGQAPWAIGKAEPVLGHDTWMKQQAKSILGRDVDLAEARELAKRIDFTTRKPIEAEASKAPSAHWLSRALRAVFGGE